MRQSALDRELEDVRPLFEDPMLVEATSTEREAESICLSCECEPWLWVNSAVAPQAIHANNKNARRRFEFADGLSKLCS